jgi:hypothetical protein
LETEAYVPVALPLALFGGLVILLACRFRPLAGHSRVVTLRRFRTLLRAMSMIRAEGQFVVVLGDLLPDFVAPDLPGR